MKFTLKNRLAGGIGHTIEVLVVAETGETIARVSTYYGGSQLANDDLSPPHSQYERIFTQVGGYSPGTRHTVLVTAMNDKGVEQTASRTWTDG